MAYRVVESKSYHARLSEAIHFRAENYGLSSARKLMNKHDKAVSTLSTMPFSGRALFADDAAITGEPLRWVRVDSYIAVYQVDSKDECVLLADLFYASSNWRERIAGR